MTQLGLGQTRLLRPEPYLKNYGTNEGLPSPEVYDIEQDDDGNLWFATDAGLSKFDGYSFKNFGLNEGLPDNVPLSIQKISHNRLVVMCLSGNLAFIEHDSICIFKYNDKLKHFNPKSYPLTFHYDDQDDQIYFAIPNFGLLQIDNATNGRHRTLVGTKANHLQLKWINEHKLFGAQIISNFPAFRAKGLPIEIEESDGKLLDANFVMYPNNDFASVWALGGDSIAILTLQGSMYLLVENKLVWQRNSDLYINTLKGAAGDLWCGLEHGGGLRHFKNNEALRDNVYEQYLEGHSVSSTFIDKAGHFWIATLDSGVWFCSSWEMPLINTKTGLQNNNISCLSRKDDSTFFVGSADFSVYEFSTRTFNIRKIPLEMPNFWIGRYFVWFPQINKLMVSDQVIDTKTGEILNDLKQKRQYSRRLSLSAKGGCCVGVYTRICKNWPG